MCGSREADERREEHENRLADPPAGVPEDPEGPLRRRASALAQLGRFPGPPFQAQCPRSATEPGSKRERAAAARAVARGHRVRAGALRSARPAAPPQPQAPQPPALRGAARRVAHRARARHGRLHGPADPALAVQPVGAPAARARRELVPLHGQRPAARHHPLGDASRNRFRSRRSRRRCPRPRWRSRTPASGSTARSTTGASCARSTRTRARPGRPGRLDDHRRSSSRTSSSATRSGRCRARSRKPASPRSSSSRHPEADPRRLPQRGLLRAACLRRAGRFERRIFPSPRSKLTLVQAALLAGLPQAPTSFDPLQHPRAARIRRNQVLHAMYTNGYITTSKLRRRSVRARAQGRAPLQRAAPAELLRLGDAAAPPGCRQARPRRWSSAGYNVKTTLDQRLQGLATHAVSGVLHSSNDPAAAIVSIDPQTGAVNAMVNYLPSGRTMQFNLATQATGRPAVLQAVHARDGDQRGHSVYSTSTGLRSSHHHAGICRQGNGYVDGRTTPPTGRGARSTSSARPRSR